MINLSLVLLVIPILTTAPVKAQDQTVGLFIYDSSSYNGYTLFAPISSTMTYLIDNYCRLIQSWSSDYPVAFAVYLRENGNLIHTDKIWGDFTGGRIQEMTWEGTLVWEYRYCHIT